MKRVFADAHFFIALLNARDQYHRAALAFATGPVMHLVTTRWILAEVADALAAVATRKAAAEFLRRFRNNRFLSVVNGSDELFDAGIQLYGARLDKEWSLTDCISFHVMSQEGLSEALTGDRHFEQAGFAALLR